jgi:hypothetical protein
MKYRWISILLVSLFIVFTSTTAEAQISLQAGIGGGMVSPLADYSGSTTDYYSGKNYGLSSGYNLHMKARLGLLALNVFAQIDYSSLSNEGESEPGKGKVELIQNVLSIKAGPEFSLGLPLIPIKPYLNVFILFNSFGGETKFNGVAKVPSGTYKLEPASRIGAGGGFGAIINLGPMTKLDLSIQYNMLNLFGKTWEDANPAKDQRLDSYLSLNDEKDPLINLDGNEHFISTARTINTLQITAALMFGL